MINKKQNLRGNVARGYQILPEGNVAVISGKSAEGTPGQYRFSVEIGAVRHYSTENELRADMQSGVVDCGFCIPRGQHKGEIGIKPAAEDRRFVELTAQRDTLGEIVLELYDGTSRKILRKNKVPSDLFKREGFDLNQENSDNHGKLLSPNLSQMLYDFQLGQG